MKQFETPEIIIEKFEVEDVITTNYMTDLHLLTQTSPGGESVVPQFVRTAQKAPM